jgi:hypothetical protein
MSSSFIAYIASTDELVNIGERWGVYSCQEDPDALAYETGNAILGSLPPSGFVRLRDGTITDKRTMDKQICHVFALGKRNTTIDRIPSGVLDQLDALFKREPQTFVREKKVGAWHDGPYELWTGETLTCVMWSDAIRLRGADWHAGPGSEACSRNTTDNLFPYGLL